MHNDQQPQHTMNSRDKILGALRAAQQPFDDLPNPDPYLPMSPLADITPAALKARFITEAEKLACRIHCAAGAADGLEAVMSLLENEQSVMSWDVQHIPLPGLSDALRTAGIAIAAPDDPGVRVGLSGVDAALATTGSLLVTSGSGKYRTASLLPPVHIAVLTADQILPDLESWVAQQRAEGLDHFRRASNVVLISGPSRTADIAMELILGMHGPGEVHIVLIENCA
jgi:L-lactate dehydrogenase complex protein LldG